MAIDPLRDIITTAKTLGEHGATTIKSIVDQITKVSSDIATRILETAPAPPAPPRPGGEVKREKITFPKFGPLPELELPSPTEVIKKIEEIPRPKIEGKEGKKVPPGLSGAEERRVRHKIPVGL